MTDPKGESALSGAHYEAIGRVVVSCSALHQILSIGAFSLAVNDSRPWNEDIRVGVLTTGMSTQTLIGAWRTLVSIHAPDDADDFNKLADQIQRTFAHRDIFAHCIWGPGPKPGTAIPVLAKTVGRLKKTQEKHYTATEITQWAETANDQAIRLFAYLFRWELAPLP